jgi:hypothetical protein
VDLISDFGNPSPAPDIRVSPMIKDEFNFGMKQLAGSEMDDQFMGMLGSQKMQVSLN